MSELAIDHLLDDKYRVVRLVGQGGWATVYEAINVRIQRRVAIKVLNAELAGKPELASRFAREAEAATQIDSPFVVTMFDAGTLPDGRPYIVMEFLEGESLGQRIERLGAVSEDDAARYVIHLLSGLADAHANGVLHRDIKPDNLVIVKSKNGEEILKLVDFGISKPNVARPEMLSMTRTDVILGSPVYMSPEQARGARHMDHRSDLYSVGVVLYEALTKAHPHSADSFNELMFKVALEDVPDPRTKMPDLDPTMCEIIVKALAREPAARFQSAIEFRDALTDWLEERGEAQPTSPFATSKFRVRRADVGLHLRATRKEHSGPPLATPAELVDTDAEHPSTGPLAEKNRRRTMALAWAAVLFLGAVGVFLMTRAAKPTPPPATATTATATTTTTATEAALSMAPPVIAPPVVAPTAEPIASASASAQGTLPARPINRATPVAGRAAPSASGRPAVSVEPTPAPTPNTASTVVEGRTVRTTF